MPRLPTCPSSLPSTRSGSLADACPSLPASQPYARFVLAYWLTSTPRLWGQSRLQRPRAGFLSRLQADPREHAARKLLLQRV